MVLSGICSHCNVKQKSEIKQLSPCAVSHAIESITQRLKTDSLPYHKKIVRPSSLSFPASCFQNSEIEIFSRPCYINRQAIFWLLTRLRFASVILCTKAFFLRKEYCNQLSIEVARYISQSEMITTVCFYMSCFPSMLLRILSICSL